MLRALSLVFLFFATTSASAQCDFKTGQYIEELSSPRNIEKITITIPNNAKWQKNAMKIVLSPTQNIPTKLKKKFKAKFEIIYAFGSCVFQGSVKQNGDWRDHISLAPEGIIRSLNAKLDQGNILNSVQFKLLLPETRGGLNEVFGVSVLKALDFITPETFQVVVSVNGIESVMLFQEAARKELLERNYKREGPLFEGDESIIWGNDRLRNDDESLSRLENKNWFLKGASSQEITLRAFSDLQYAYMIRGNNSAEMGQYIDPNALNNLANSQNLSFPQFHFAMQALGADHGFVFHNRKFYFNVFDSSFEPVYYDGNVFSSFNNLRMRAASHIPFDGNIIRNAYDNLDVTLYGDLILSDQIKDNSKNYFLERSGLLNDDASKSFESYWEVFSLRAKKLQNEIYATRSVGKVNNSILSSYNYLEQLDVFIERANKNNSIDLLALGSPKKDKGSYLLELQNQQNKRISSAELANILSKNELNGKRVTLLNYNKNNKNQKTSVREFQDGEIISSVNLKVSVNNDNRTLKFDQLNPTDWVLLKDLTLKDWKIEFAGSSEISQSSIEQRFNDVGLTGCLNFYNSKFKSVDISVTDGGCEDSLNLVNADGFLDEVRITNAFADAVDIDFSNISIGSLVVNKAGNDCFDVSSGNYKIKKAELTQCGDKGISVGEASRLNAENISLFSVNIGVSSKDSSKVDISTAVISAAITCIEVKNKKQEFGGAALHVGYLDCDGTTDVDKHSELKVGLQ
tara:strand:+ start:787 stop:3018 length:2232 start_codon:yes stop_codon:yes gene_type:complete